MYILASISGLLPPSIASMTSDPLSQRSRERLREEREGLDIEAMYVLVRV